MKRLLRSICLLSLLLVFISYWNMNFNAAKESKHVSYTSFVQQRECFLCKEHNNSLDMLHCGEDNIAILNLNSFTFLSLEINRYHDNGELITQKAGYAAITTMTCGESHVHAFTESDRGCSRVTIQGKRNTPNTDIIQRNLCQNCFDMMNEACCGDTPYEEYAILNLLEKTIRPLTVNTTQFFSGNYEIECNYEENGNINLLVNYSLSRCTDS